MMKWGTVAVQGIVDRNSISCPSRARPEQEHLLGVGRIREQTKA